MKMTNKKKSEWKKSAVAASFILPSFLGFSLFSLFPMFSSFVLAFTKWDSFTPAKFIGLKNFERLIRDDTFWISLKNTILYTAGVVPLTLFFAMFFAIILNNKFLGNHFFRISLFFPYITSLVAVAAVWNMLFHPTMGPINHFLEQLMAHPPGWLTSSDWALFTVVIVSVWRHTGYYMILYLAGLQTIPKEIYEAAEVDGAKGIKKHWYITIPSLRPTTFLVMMILTINSFKIFDLIQVMTNGGPGRATNVLVFQIYKEAFVKFNFGYASAISWVLFLIVLMVTIIQFRWNKKK